MAGRERRGAEVWFLNFRESVQLLSRISDDRIVGFLRAKKQSGSTVGRASCGYRFWEFSTNSMR